MRRCWARCFTLLLSLCLLQPLLVPLSANAEIQYRTYSRDSYGRVIWTQPAFLPVSVMATEMFIENPDQPGEMMHTSLNNPQDLFITSRDEIYIADTGNHRIIHLSADGELIRIIDFPENPLKSPEGVFVDARGNIYIADTGNRRIVLANAEGQFIREYVMPESRFIPKTYQFDPFDLVVDRRGFMYVASKGSYQGLMLIDPEGKFHGFFGTNSTEASVFDRLKLLIYSEEQLSREVRLLPAPIRNLEIDKVGFVYTTTLGPESEQIKKFNIRSENVLPGLRFGEMRASTKNDPQLIDISIDPYNNIYAVDAANTTINVYSSHGDLLFFWSGNTTPGHIQLGLVQSPSAVASNSKGELFILDATQNNIQRMKPSEFGNLVFTAMNLMDEGKYEESVPYFEQIIRLNANFSPAYKGLGLAAYHRGEYAKALELFEMAGDKEGYSESFWQLRLLWFQNNFAWLANTFLVITLLWVAWGTFSNRFHFRQKQKSRERKHRLAEQLLHGFYLVKHPIEGFGDLRYDNKGSYVSALILLALALTVLPIKLYYTNFHFTGNTPVHEMNMGVVLLQFVVFWVSWVVCNYLISAIYHGEGRFSDVLIGSSYALTPIILLSVPIAVISNGLTLSESSIYNFFEWLMMIWVAMMAFWMVKSVQNYSIGETIVNIFLTIIAIIILWVVIFIIFGLASEFINFLYSVYQEVTMR